MRNFKKRTDMVDLPRIEAVSRTFVERSEALAPAQDESIQKNVGSLLEVSVKALKDNPFNARRIVSTSGLDDLANSLKLRGQDTAALAYLDETGELCLIDGHRRLEAARIAGMETLRVEIRPRPATDQELYLQSRSANTDREAQTPLDDALAWKLLLEKKVFESQVELCRKLNLEPTAVSRTLGLAELPKTLIRMLSERPELMTLRMLDAIKRYADVAGEESAEALILEIDREGLSSRDVDKRRLAFEKGPVSRQRSHYQNFKYDRGHAIVKKFAGQGRLVVEITEIATETEVDHLTEKISQAIHQVLAEQI